MKKFLLFFLFFPICLFGQEDTTQTYRNTLKTNILSPWTNYQTISLSFENHQNFRRIIEYEVYYHTGVAEFNAPKSLSVPKKDLNFFSGGLQVALKRHRTKESRYFWAYEGAYNYYNFTNLHTVCTEVDTAQDRICPCLSFTDNEYQHKINQLSAGFRLGWQTPVVKYFKRLRFEFYFSAGARVAFGKEIGKLTHVFCSEELENTYNQTLKENNISSLRFLKDSKETLLAPYFFIGLKLGYAF